MMLEATTIADLSSVLLAEILSRLSVEERLRHAGRVNRSWQRAAAIVTKEIHARNMQNSPDSLSAWMAANCPNAALRSIIAGGNIPDLPTLLLPVQHLQHLSELRLAGVRVTATQYSSPHAAAPAEASLHPLGIAPLTALTQLEVIDCDMRFDGLSALTNLQSLAHSASRQRPWLTFNTSLQELAVALPALQHLTSLRLAGNLSQDSIVQRVHSLTCLQELYLSACAAGSLQQMPPSLTKLVIAPQDRYCLQLSPSTTPGLCQLTALKHLDAPYTGFSVELLPHMTALQELKLHYARLEGPGGLSVLTGLTQLQHLTLPAAGCLPEAEWVQPVLQGPADIAAITASSQLTYLDISMSLDNSDDCAQAFQGKQLPHLVELRISFPGLCDDRTAPLVAKCCPNLERLCFGSDDVFDDAYQAEAAREAAWFLPEALRCWVEPASTGQGLTSLQLAVAHCDMLEVWPVLGCLTKLCSLCVLGAAPDQLPGMLGLKDCAYLRVLHISTYDAENPEDALIHIVSEATQDGTTRMHEKLHSSLHSLVLQLEDGSAAYPELLAGVLACDLDAQRGQQQQIADLQKQVADLQQLLQ